MRPLSSTTRTAVATILALGLFVGNTFGTPPLAFAASHPTAGTITVQAKDVAVQGGKTITITCKATFHIVSTTEVDISVEGTYKSVDNETNASGTTTTIYQAKTATPYKEIHGGDFLPTITLNREDGRVPIGHYGIAFHLPATVRLDGTFTTSVPNTPKQPAQPWSTYVTCPVFAPLFSTGLVVGPLHGTASLHGRQPIAWDWAGIIGTPSGTITWNLTDRDLATATPVQPQQHTHHDLPTGHIRITPHGIEASLEYKGFELSFAADWKAEQKQTGSPPQLISPDQSVHLTIDEQGPEGTPNGQSPAATALRVIAGLAGPNAAISSQPFAAGALQGVIETITIPGLPNTLEVIVVGDGRRQIVVRMTITPHATSRDLLAAGAALGSIALTS